VNGPFDEARAQLLEAVSHLLHVEPPSSYRTPKIIHDAIWGTCEYDPWEVGLLDLPVFQRLRGLKQTGFAYLTYPAAEHSRFQHVLGVVQGASRVFDSLRRRAPVDGLSPRARQAKGGLPALTDDPVAARYRVLLRLAALVHDLGHSLLSHTSERIFSLIAPFPELIATIQTRYDKRPGAAEVMVYLLVTSRQWQEACDESWERGAGPGPPPNATDWERIGRWVMGIEPDGAAKFICDIISGPLDADKLDYVARDSYFAGIPVTHDLDRFLSTVCVDYQTDPSSGRSWYRLTLPIHRGINALEQLVMSKLVLFSYLYHHQKVRAAEATFERALAREYLTSKTIAGLNRVWDLFRVQDAHLYAMVDGYPGRLPAADVAYRVLPRRVAEFRQQDVTDEGSANEASQVREYRRLARLGRPKSWDAYKDLLAYEDKLASTAGLRAGSVVVDFPSDPDYGELESLLLPGRTPDEETTAKQHLSYSDWIQAYNKHRVYARVFSFGERRDRDRVWTVLRDDFAGRGLTLSPRLQIGK